MHVDLVESLRCPHAHEDGWLVASADEVVQRRIVRGAIGCPQCGAEWTVRDCVLSFGEEALSAFASEQPAPDASLAMRLAALLDLRDSRGTVALVGESSRLCDQLAELTGVLLLAVNAPHNVAAAHSRLYVAGGLPLGVGTVRGVVLDSQHSGPVWLASAARALERGGRLVAPASTAVPPEVKELARDATEWVGEVRVAASGLVPLRRGGTV